MLTKEVDRKLLRRRSAGKGQRRHDSIFADRGQDRFELHRTEDEEYGHDAQCEAEVTHAVGYEGLDGRVVRRLLRVPETDQQVGREAHAFPAEEELDEIVRHDQRQHREGKQRQVGKEARPVRIFAHIAPGIEVHEAGDARDNGHHHNRKRVDTDRPIGLEGANVDPWQQRDDVRAIHGDGLDRMADFFSMAFAAMNTGGVGKQLEQRQGAREQDRARCQDHDRRIADLLMNKTRQRHDTGRQYDEEDEEVRKHVSVTLSSGQHSRPRYRRDCGNTRRGWRGRRLLRQRRRSGQAWRRSAR